MDSAFNDHTEIKVRSQAQFREPAQKKAEKNQNNQNKKTQLKRRRKWALLVPWCFHLPNAPTIP